MTQHATSTDKDDDRVDMPEYEQFSVQLGAKSRIVVPARVREKLGLAEGDRLILRVHKDNTITLFSRKEAARRGFGMFAHIDSGSNWADELIAERREEVRREDEDYRERAVRWKAPPTTE